MELLVLFLPKDPSVPARECSNESLLVLLPLSSMSCRDNCVSHEDTAYAICL